MTKEEQTTRNKIRTPAEDLKYINQLIDTTANKHGVLPVPFSKTTVRFLLAEAMEAQRKACAEAFKESLSCVQWNVQCPTTHQVNSCKIDIHFDNQYKAILEAEVQP